MLLHQCQKSEFLCNPNWACDRSDRKLDISKIIKQFQMAAESEDPPVTMGLSDEDLRTVNPSFWDTVWDMFTMYDEHMDDRDVKEVRRMEKYHRLFHKKYPEFMPRIYHD